MFRIEDIMSGDFSSYPKKVQEFMEAYTEKLRENIINELSRDLAEKMLKDLEKGNETFITVLSEILEKGCKGFNEMSTRKLVNIYLERKDQEDFINLLEKVNAEVE